MISAIQPLITDIVQVCVVVRDLDATMKKYVELMGVGPWAVYDFGPPDVANATMRGKPTTYRAKLAVTWTKERMWEIIQPLEGNSPYQEFLDQHGEGMHHTLVQHAGHKFDDALARFRSHGCELLMTCEFRGTRVAYLDTADALKMYVELIDRPPVTSASPRRPNTPPAHWYPAAPPADHVW